MSETVVKPEAFAELSKTLTHPSGAMTVKSSFDRSTHMPFRLDNKGLNKEATLKEFKKGVIKDTDEVRMPTWWQRGSKTNANRTLTEVNMNRRKQQRPDLSFDLDGDGVVGNRDLVIAKLFDKDGDGKLNATERAAADEAIRNVSINCPLSVDFLFCGVGH